MNTNNDDFEEEFETFDRNLRRSARCQRLYKALSTVIGVLLLLATVTLLVAGAFWLVS